MSQKSPSQIQPTPAQNLFTKYETEAIQAESLKSQISRAQSYINLTKKSHWFTITFLMPEQMLTMKHKDPSLPYQHSDIEHMADLYYERNYAVFNLYLLGQMSQAFVDRFLRKSFPIYGLTFKSYAPHRLLIKGIQLPSLWIYFIKDHLLLASRLKAIEDNCHKHRVDSVNLNHKNYNKLMGIH